MRSIILAAALVALAAPIAAQQRAADPDVKATGKAAMPKGWRALLDRANANAAELQFTTMGKGFHATTGPAAIFFDPAKVAKGDFRLTGSFTQTKAPTHPEAYGLVFGATNLDDRTKQQYVYVLVRGDGKYMIRHRAGADVHTIQDWTAHEAVNKADAAGKATNVITVEAKGPDLNYIINGKKVHRQDHSYVGGNGVVGLRVNHNLDVHIGEFKLEPIRK
jgi:hypothetical protein